MALGKSFKKFWHSISTGWVLEYPDADGPKDLFDRRNIGVTQGQLFKECLERDRKDSDQSSREDAVFKWREQILASGR